MNLKCSKCGNKIETIPQHCGSDMIFDEETGQLECCMGTDCTYVPLSELMCSKCEDFD